MSNSKDVSELGRTIADICVEFWKLARSAGRALAHIDEREGKRFSSQVRYSERQLEAFSQQLGFRLVEFDGKNFDAGVAASADNLQDFEDGIPLVVTKTLEPAVVSEMRVVRLGRVLVGPKPEMME